MLRLAIQSGILAASLGCAPKLSHTVPDQLLARRPLCLAVDWIGRRPPGLEGREPPDTVILMPSEGAPNNWAKEFELSGEVALTRAQQSRIFTAVWGMARDSLRINGYSLFENFNLILAKPGSEREAVWFYSKDLGPSLRGRARLKPFPCEADSDRNSPTHSSVLSR
jgi:hypothetical protein